MLITQSQIADLFKRSLSNVRKHAMGAKIPSADQDRSWPYRAHEPV